MAQQKGIAESVKDAIVDSIRGTGEVVNVVVDTVNRTLVNALKGTGAVGTAVTTTLTTSPVPRIESTIASFTDSAMPFC